MFVQPDLLTYAENKPLFSRPYFHLTDAGQIGFNTFGKEAPPLAVKKLLEKNQISSDEICLISHQSSSVLMEFWQNAAQPKQYINTLEIFANMELAVLPVNFAFCYDEIKTEYVVLLGIGMDFQTSAVLLKRN